MIISIDIAEQDRIRLEELKKATEATTRSAVIRESIRFYHKYFFNNLLTVDSKHEAVVEAQGPAK